MTLQLLVNTGSWDQHIDNVINELEDIVPVIKGNGYGFGRLELVDRAMAISSEICVGNVVETVDLPAACIPIVLTPSATDLPKKLHPNSVLLIGSIGQLGILQQSNWSGPIIVKVRSSVQRYGVDSQHLPGLLQAIADSDCHQVGWSIHPPLDNLTNKKQISDWIAYTNSNLPWFVSHIDGISAGELRKMFPGTRIRLRSGTKLWLGDKSMFKLSSNVLDLHKVKKGDLAGYRNSIIPTDGTIVVVGTGTSNGITQLGGGLSPFHFMNKRLELIEPPHMHASLVFIDEGQECPEFGASIDVQQPFTRIFPDLITWR